MDRTLPPQPAPARRQFIQTCGGALLGAASVALGGCGTRPAAAAPAPASFLHGVASGDPLHDRVILWTRITPGAGAESEVITLRWQLATDAALRHIVAAGSVQASAQHDFTAKVDAAGLLPGHVYYYQFSADGQHSPVGRTRTLPDGAVGAVRLAVFSCSNYPAGYFNVYADAARQDDIDVALHLGDYIYEYESDGYASANAEALGRVSEPRGQLYQLGDYRRRYAQYRSDPDLQALHAAMPFITVWDDHEFADDTWRDGALEHNSALHGPFSVRKAAAVRAYHEWLPIRAPDPATPEKIYRSFDFGNVLSLHMLDTRLTGRDQQLLMSSYLDGQGRFDEAKFRGDAGSPRRQMLGRDQMAWLAAGVAASGARWQMLGQQVLMARMEYPMAIATGQCGCTEFAALKQRASRDPEGLSAREKAWLAAATLPCYLDSWDGYQHERELVFELMRRHRKNLVVLAGDTHNAWASDLHDAAGRTVGVEFATASVSSPGMEGGYPGREPEDVANMMVDLIGPLYYAQTSKRGYMIVTASHAEVRCDWRFVDTVLSRDFTATTERSLRTLAGPGNRCLLECGGV